MHPDSTDPAAPVEPAATRFDSEGEPLAELDFYCPGCGRRYSYMTECRGQSAETPHPPIEVVSTGELTGDPEKHTPAPASQ